MDTQIKMACDECEEHICGRCLKREQLEDALAQAEALLAMYRERFGELDGT
jgi:hypothetical protein